MTPPLPFPPRDSGAHKGDFGRVLLIGGSRGMAGSISLSAIAALHSGSGLVSVAVPDRCLETVASFHPCLMTIPLKDDARGQFCSAAICELTERIGPFDAIGCGPGMTVCEGAMEIVKLLLRQRNCKRVLDADAINCLAKMQWATAPASDAGPLVLTPHGGELQRLTGVNAKDREAQVDAAQSLAAHHGVTIVVKGGPTVVVDGDRRWTNDTGNPGMATGGTGDVLTGTITSLLGQGMTPWDAARLGVWLHGAAGDAAAKRQGQTGMTALDLLQSLAPLTAVFENRAI
ncbi:NAD(P)H-hydrate dehydratase [Novipirellula artificiosorum]|uniref:ADP-dependent (S)-NAD(P)H-hydrate dehydratase n=1 Tax=Novipirellula artificiosorum TaxID=2528016 RepID=A0A5C6E4T8_9BACT|nr:NAD(P)H-hydrate dehydratase [Novipirellula artificiosorum]TWU42169.1 ATP-dependent (S)-NAD(P)H-hydrate dehydratase [Novipirellula artificiosorum]